MLEQFIEKNFAPASRLLIEQANDIITAYRLQGYTLTLRQLYYQFVARDLIENTMRSYKRLGSVINDGRLAGLIDWSAIEDRTRNLVTNWHTTDPSAAIKTIRDQYRIDMWENQVVRVEVWIEKEALIGVIEPVCRELDVPFFACRGYVSQSEQWRAYRRHANHQGTIILHLGDHDPSGIDMTRDNQDRLNLFGGFSNSHVERIALNMDQIEEFNPPPNPAKMTDSRFEKYMAEHGDKSWELDALEPKFIDELIREHVDKYRDMDLWEEKEAQVREDIETFDDILAGL